jgi:opacity protein-like surface antigen
MTRLPPTIAARALLLAAVAAWPARAVDFSVAPTPRAHTTRATQYGAYVGGTASQYDLCVSKGHLPRGNTPAERIARMLLDRLHQPNPAADMAPYAYQGWDLAKQDLARHAAEYDKEKCVRVSAQWTTLLAASQSK